MGGRGAYFNKHGKFKFSSSKKTKETNKPKTLKISNQTVTETLIIQDSIVPKGVEITDVHIFAGKGVQKPFRDAKKYNDEYGLPPSEIEQWYHAAGKVESDKYIFDIHTVAHEKLGIVRMYIKRRSEKR